LVAALVGAAVGAGVALLFAPCSGKETRGWLAERTQDIKGRTTNAFEQGKASMRRAAAELGRESDTMVTNLRP
jgi:gas vesicle protein